MALFTLTCAFHDTVRLLEQTLPLAIRSLTQPTRHEFQVVLVADRSSTEVVSGLVGRLAELGVDELRFRRDGPHSFSGAPSNNFHGHQFATTSPYLVSFTDDTFIWKGEDTFDVLDAVAGLFVRHPEVVMVSKVDDHEEWDLPLADVGPQLEPGVRCVNRVVDQLIAYDTDRFARVARRFGAWERDAYVEVPGVTYQWENLASRVGTTGGRKIAFPEGWPLRVRHCDLRTRAGSMHGTQDETVKLACFQRLWDSQGVAKT